MPLHVNSWVLERRFYSGMIIALAAVVFVGFAPSFYLRSFFADARPLTPLLYVHGVVFSTWIALLVTQSVLVTSRRPDLHRRLGALGLILAMAVLIVGAATALTLAARLLYSKGANAAAHAALALLDLPVFASLVLAAVLLRRRSQTHKRLMLLATVVIVGAAVNRLPLPAEFSGRFVRFFILDLFLFSLVIWDLLSAGRIYLATLVGTSAIFLDQMAQVYLGQAEWWSRSIAKLLQVMPH